MNKNPYSIPTLEIIDSREIAKARTRTHFIKRTEAGKELHFLFSPARDKGDQLLISFHGALSIINKDTKELTSTPLFRGYNWKIPGVDILCIYDPLLDDYAGEMLQMAWFLDTAIHKHSIDIAEVIGEISSQYKHVITTGSSAGGFPAIKYAILTSGHAVIMNPQLYLSRYAYHWKNLVSVLLKHGDSPVGPIDVEALLSKFGHPKSITLYINQLDEHHKFNHVDPFLEYSSGDKAITVIEFENPTEPIHNSFLPLGQEVLDILHEKFVALRSEVESAKLSQIVSC